MSQPNRKSSKEIIDEFFYSFHSVEAEESLRELLRAIADRHITTSALEKKDFAYFLQRLTELVKFLIRDEHKQAGVSALMMSFLYLG